MAWAFTARGRAVYNPAVGDRARGSVARVVGCAVMVGCLLTTAPPAAAHPGSPATGPSEVSPPERARVPVGRLMGRLVFTGFSGTQVDAHVRHLLRDVGVGGLIYRSHNVRSRSQVLALSRGIEQAAGRPVFVAVTQEPGVVDHLAGIFPDLPSPPELASRRPWASRMAGCTLGSQLASIGIDLDFAPVLDVLGPPGAFIGSRSYGRDPEVVADHGAAFVRGLAHAGIFAVAKHFPGHGGVAEDSHERLPVDRRPLYALRNRDLVPFEAAFDAGVPGVMTSHVSYPRVDPDFPASLSRVITTELLRDRLRFGGLVVTDDLEMGALRGRSLELRAVRAIAAGADMVLIGSSSGEVPRVVAALRRAVRSGKIPRSRALEAVGDVLAALRRSNELHRRSSVCPRWTGVTPDALPG